ncbi:MAG: hypothetical protein LCH81_17500 [Bacteroidetes bacterium]|nr:hypothetical protein [Bacteroidota bacterium]
MFASTIKTYMSALCILLLSVTGLNAQTEVVATLDSVVETGDPFVLQLHLPDVLGVVPEDVDFSPWDSIFPAENILSQTAWEHTSRGYDKAVTLITFDGDSAVQLPPLTIALKGGGQALTNPLQLTILPTPSPDDLRDMADIKDIRREPFSWKALLYAYRDWLILLVGVLALALIVYLLFRQKYRSDAALSRSVQLPSHDYARRRLEALAKRQLWQQGQLKSYYAELTHIVREYLEKRYQIPALESVSDEIVRQLHATDFPASLMSDLQRLLSEADLAKFAQSAPPDSYHAEAMRTAEQIVAQTIESQVIQPNPAS